MFDDPPPVSEETSTRGLFERWLDGDSTAGEHLLVIHRERLARALRLRVPARHRSVLDVEDVLQETLRKAFERRQAFEYDGVGSFLAWLVAIARRLLLDRIRTFDAQRRSAARTMSLDDGVAENVAMDPQSRTPSRQLAAREDQEFLECAFDTLEESERDLLVRRFTLGQSLADIARAVDRSAEGVRSAIRRARGKLIQHYETHGRGLEER